MGGTTVTALDRRLDAVERGLHEFGVELRRWLERRSRRRHGRSHRPRPREESGETVESATVKKPIAMREPEKEHEEKWNEELKADLKFEELEGDEVLEKVEEIVIDLKAHNSKGIVKPVTHEEFDGIRRNVGNLFVAVKPKTEKENYVDEVKTHFVEGMVENEGTHWEGKVESEKNDDRGSRGRVTVKRDDSDEDDNDEDDGDEELPPAEPPPEESPVKAIDGGANVEEVVPDRDLRERTHSLMTELCDGEGVVEEAGRKVRVRKGDVRIVMENHCRRSHHQNHQSQRRWKIQRQENCRRSWRCR